MKHPLYLLVLCGFRLLLLLRTYGEVRPKDVGLGHVRLLARPLLPLLLLGLGERHRVGFNTHPRNVQTFIRTDKHMLTLISKYCSNFGSRDNKDNSTPLPCPRSRMPSSPSVWPCHSSSSSSRRRCRWRCSTCSPWTTRQRISGSEPCNQWSVYLSILGYSVETAYKVTGYKVKSLIK